MIGWTVVYVANLIVPVFFGRLICDTDDALLGMGAGVFVWWAVLSPICFRPGRLRIALVVGAGFVAIAQFLPILHIVAGTVAIDFWKYADGKLGKLNQLNTFSAGFSVTILTGFFLLAIALAVGFLLAFDFHRRRPKGRNATTG